MDVIYYYVFGVVMVFIPGLIIASVSRMFAGSIDVGA